MISMIPISSPLKFYDLKNGLAHAVLQKSSAYKEPEANPLTIVLPHSGCSGHSRQANCLFVFHWLSTHQVPSMAAVDRYGGSSAKAVAFHPKDSQDKGTLAKQRKDWFRHSKRSIFTKQCPIYGFTYQAASFPPLPNYNFPLGGSKGCTLVLFVLPKECHPLVPEKSKSPWMVRINPWCPMRTQKSGCIRKQNLITYPQLGYACTQQTEVMAWQSGKIKEMITLQHWGMPGCLSLLRTERLQFS